MPDLPHRLDAPLCDDVVALALSGLTAARKTLTPSLFYDEEGCRLFERITRLPEYYPTRTEMALLPSVAADVARLTKSGAVVVEYGASSEAKAAILLAALHAPAAWIPIDVAAPSLHRAAERLRRSIAGLEVHPLAADFLQPITLPNRIGSKAVIGFFPGSTIGNLDHRQAQFFLARASATLGPSALFLIGVDLPKDRSILIPAYDDAQGVTAAFNRNLLHRLNREADADFDPDSFAHRALWNAAESRIEMHLVSMRAQTAHLAGHAIFFDEGETIHTENSHKYGIEAFHMLARAAGWRPVRHWLDADELFSIHLLSAK